MVQEMKTLETPRTVRVKFEKVGRLKYISHLDLNRTFSHALVRAKLPVWYTMGFNPHTKMTFATPLSVGSESVCEYMDIKIVKDMPTDEIKIALAAAFAPGLNVVDVYYPETKFSDIAWSEYEIRLHMATADDSLAKKITELFERDEIRVVKRTKSGDKETNIKPFILRFAATLENGDIIIRTVLCCDTLNFLNPEYLMTVIKSEFGLFEHESIDERYDILRKEVFFSDGVTPFR